MSEQPAPTRTGLGSVQIRARLNRLNFTRQQGILGPAEIIALASSVLILVLVIVS